MKNFKNNFFYGSMVALLILIAATFVIIQKPTATSNTEAHSFQLTNCRLSCKSMRCVYDCLQGTFVKNTPTPIAMMPTATPIILAPTIAVSTNIPVSTVIPTAIIGNSVDVKNFGAKGDGLINDTAAIQSAIDSLGSTGGNISIPAGTYMIDAVKSIIVKGNVNIQMTSTTVLKTILNTSDWSSIITFKNVSNASITGGTLVGDRNNHTSAGEHGMGVSVYGGSNITIKGIASNDMFGDGFYVATGLAVPVNVQLTDVTANNNRRQGISIISGKDIIVTRPRLTNTVGTPPAYGLDIEPNKITDTLQNINITEPYTANNQGAGIGINLVKLEGTTVPVSIKITNPTDSGSQRGFNSVNAINIPGSVVIDNPIWKNNKLNGFAVTNHHYTAYSVTVNNPQVIDANMTGSLTAASTGAAFAMYSYNDAVTMGNIYINNAKITDTRVPVRTIGGFYVANTNNQAVVNISIVNPIISGSVTMLKAATSTGVKVQ